MNPVSFNTRFAATLVTQRPARSAFARGSGWRAPALAVFASRRLVRDPSDHLKTRRLKRARGQFVNASGISVGTLDAPASPPYLLASISFGYSEYQGVK